MFFVHARRPFEEAAVEIEDIARVGFAAGRAFQDKRDLAVGDRMFGKIVVNNQRIATAVHEPFADGAARKGGEVLVGGGVGGGSHHDHRVGHRAMFFEHADDARNIGLFLADGNVDRV